MIIFMNYIIILLLFVTFFVYMATRYKSNNKLDSIGKATNTILAILYLPMSVISLIMTVASQLTIGVTDPWVNFFTDAYCWSVGLFPVVCLLCLYYSFRLRSKGRSKLSFIIQFLPLAAFGLNMSFAMLLDYWY